MKSEIRQISKFLEQFISLLIKFAVSNLLKSAVLVNLKSARVFCSHNEATKEILLAVDKEKLEFDAMNDILDTLMEEFKKEAKPDTSFLDWLKSKDKDYFQRLKYDAGGPVKPKVKEDIPIKDIDLDSQLNKLGETFLRMNKAEREVVKDLLRRSGLFDK